MSIYIVFKIMNVIVLVSFVKLEANKKKLEPEFLIFLCYLLETVKREIMEITLSVLC